MMNELTPRENEIVLQLKQGKSNKEIASDLIISVNTVRTHVSKIYKKTGVKTRLQLLIKILKNDEKEF